MWVVQGDPLEGLSFSKCRNECPYTAVLEGDATSRDSGCFKALVSVTNKDPKHWLGSRGKGWRKEVTRMIL